MYNGPPCYVDLIVNVHSIPILFLWAYHTIYFGDILVITVEGMTYLTALFVTRYVHTYRIMTFLFCGISFMLYC